MARPPGSVRRGADIEGGRDTGRMGVVAPAAVLGAGTALANALAYATSVAVSRATGPATFGAIAAVVALGVIGNVPATSLQLVVARRTASKDGQHGHDLGGLRASVELGLVLFATCVALAPVLDRGLGLDGIGAPLVLGLTLIPQTVAGALQGDLLGHRRFGALAASFVAAAGGRFLAGTAAAFAGWSLTGILGAVAAASVVTAVVTAGLCRLRPSGPWFSSAAPPWRELAAAGSLTAGILVLTNLDVLLARAFLSTQASGIYAVAALFAKASFWAPHFVAVLVFPRIASGVAVRRALVASVALTAAIGGTVVLATWLWSRPIISMTSGSAYTQGGWLPVAFAVLGMLFALVQLLLLSALAASDRRAELIVWLAVVMEVALVTIKWHGSAGQIVGVALATSLSAAIAGLVARADDLRRVG